MSLGKSQEAVTCLLLQTGGFIALRTVGPGAMIKDKVDLGGGPIYLLIYSLTHLLV